MSAAEAIPALGSSSLPPLPLAATVQADLVVYEGPATSTARLGTLNLPPGAAVAVVATAAQTPGGWAKLHPTAAAKLDAASSTGDSTSGRGEMVGLVKECPSIAASSSSSSSSSTSSSLDLRHRGWICRRWYPSDSGAASESSSGRGINEDEDDDDTMDSNDAEGFELFLDSEVEPSPEAAPVYETNDGSSAATAAAAAELASTPALEEAVKVSTVYL